MDEWMKSGLRHDAAIKKHGDTTNWGDRIGSQKMITKDYVTE